MIVAVLPGRGAEEAVRVATALDGAAGFAVGQDLLAGPGPAVVAALADLGEVLVLAGLQGDPGRAASAARRYAGYGAGWVSAQASDGAAVIEAVASAGVAVVAATVRHGIDDAEAARIGGRSRGRAVSRLAEIAAAGGAAGILCDLSDLGVVSQVAPGLERFVWVDTPREAVEAAGRGAERIMVDAAAVAATRAALDQE
ncbi:MAG TPA: hypothetical protein VK960_09545 [Acidimicrobiia bacterium]|nr:hypothetical protein [Acidimicrobiia bacterium]